MSARSCRRSRSRGRPGCLRNLTLCWTPLIQHTSTLTADWQYEAFLRARDPSALQLYRVQGTVRVSLPTLFPSSHPYRALIAPLSHPYPAPPPFVPSRLFPFLEPSRAPAPFFLPFFAFSAPFSPPPSHSILFFASHKINTLLYSAPNTGTPNEARARNS